MKGNGWGWKKWTLIGEFDEVVCERNTNKEQQKVFYRAILGGNRDQSGEKDC